MQQHTARFACVFQSAVYIVGASLFKQLYRFFYVRFLCTCMFFPNNYLCVQIVTFCGNEHLCSTMAAQMAFYIEGHSWYFMTPATLLYLALDTLASPDAIFFEMVGTYNVKAFPRILSTYTQPDDDIRFSYTLAVLATDDGHLVDVFPVIPSQQEHLTVQGLRLSRYF